LTSGIAQDPLGRAFYAVQGRTLASVAPQVDHIVAVDRGTVYRVFQPCLPVT